MTKKISKRPPTMIVRLEPELKESFRKACDHMGRTMNTQTELLIRDWLSSFNKKYGKNPTDRPHILL